MTNDEIGMTKEKILETVKAAIADRWEERNHHGINPRETLVEPKKIVLIFRKVKDGQVIDSHLAAWLILEERPLEKNGYKIVASEDGLMFGLASAGFKTDRYPILVGWYGSFWSAFHSM